MRYAKGLQEVGDGLYAYLQPDGGWGWSNAGVVNVANIYGELNGDQEPINPLVAFQQMAELAGA
jgi:hypothetical protein